MPDPESGSPRSRTRTRRQQFVEANRLLVHVVTQLEDDVLEQGWKVEPVAVSYQDARNRFPRKTLAGKNRPFDNADDYAAKMLNHCARRYSLEDTHEGTLRSIVEVLEAGTGAAPLQVLREAVRKSSELSVREMVSSQPWLASVVHRTTVASRTLGDAAGREERSIWEIDDSPMLAFAGIYVALFSAIGYQPSPKRVTLLAWDIAAVTEGLCIAELSRARSPGVRPRRVRTMYHRRATDTDDRGWPLLGFLIMKLLEPMLGDVSGAESVADGAATRFIIAMSAQPGFAVPEA